MEWGKELESVQGALKARHEPATKTTITGHCAAKVYPFILPTETLKVDIEPSAHQVCGEAKLWKHKVFSVCIRQWIIIIKMSILSATQEMWPKTEPRSEVADPHEDKRV